MHATPNPTGHIYIYSWFVRVVIIVTALVVSSAYFFNSTTHTDVKYLVTLTISWPVGYIPMTIQSNSSRFGASARE